MKGWTPKLKLVEEESAGSSCDIEKSIFEGRVLEEEDKELLMRLRAWDWVFREKSANADANCLRLLSVAVWEANMGEVFVVLSVSTLEGALSVKDIVMTAGTSKGAIKTGPLVIAEVSLSVAAGGGTEPEVMMRD